MLHTHMLRRALTSLLLAGVVFSQQTPALAQDAAELKKARAQFQQATELEQAGNWTAALQAFREVGQVRMTPQVRFHIAVCEEKLGRLVAALGSRPCVWITPPRWKQDSGVVRVIRENSALCRYLDSDTIVHDVPRARDKIHPTEAGREQWAEAVLTWLKQQRAPEEGKPWALRQ